MINAKTRICIQPIQVMRVPRIFQAAAARRPDSRSTTARGLRPPNIRIAWMSLEVIAALSVSPGQSKEANRYQDENDVCHKTPKANRVIVAVPALYNLTSSAAVSRFSFLTKSGDQPGTNEPGSPWFPPGGVTPPRPDQ